MQSFEFYKKPHFCNGLNCNNLGKAPSYKNFYNKINDLFVTSPQDCAYPCTITALFNCKRLQFFRELSHSRSQRSSSSRMLLKKINNFIDLYQFINFLETHNVQT